MKDDTGLYAVFTEQESSASQITAAKVIISRPPVCAGQAAVHPGQNGRRTDVC